MFSVPLKNIFNILITFMFSLYFKFIVFQHLLIGSIFKRQYFEVLCMKGGTTMGKC